VNFPPGNTFLTFNNDIGTGGTAAVSWNPNGVVDASAESVLLLDIGIDGGIAPNNTSTFTIEFCSDATCTSRYTRSWSLTGSIGAPTTTYGIALSSFIATGAPNWANLVRASLTITSGNASDIRIDNILLATPEPGTMILLGSALAGFALLRRR
jgi:hypothetical protein